MDLEQPHVDGRMTKSSGHMQQLNAENEGQNIGGDMGVFYGGSDRLIGQNKSFLNSTEPTQGLIVSLSQ